MAAHPNFRIATNGFEFRVELKGRAVFSREEYWAPHSMACFSTKKQAEDELDDIVVHLARATYEWKPVK